MPRPASKKKPAKSVVKGSASSAESAVIKELEKAQKKLDVQREKLRIARDKLREKRAAAKIKKTAGSVTALEKAYSTVATHSVAVSELTNSVRLAKAEVRIEAVLKKATEAQITAELKLEKTAQTLADNSAADLKVAVERYQKRWLKQREQADARKLKLAAAHLREKTKSIEKKATAEAAAIRKRAIKLSAKPVTVPGRPGRPAGSLAKATNAVTTPKRRGRPPKATVDTTGDAPKRRGRPPKAAVSPEKGTTTKVSTTQKKRGRPAKAKTAIASTAAKAEMKTKVEAEPTLADGKVGAPKKRGRPRKVVKS